MVFKQLFKAYVSTKPLVWWKIWRAFLTKDYGLWRIYSCFLIFPFQNVPKTARSSYKFNLPRNKNPVRNHLVKYEKLVFKKGTYQEGSLTIELQFWQFDGIFKTCKSGRDLAVFQKESRTNDTADGNWKRFEKENNLRFLFGADIWSLQLWTQVFKVLFTVV